MSRTTDIIIAKSACFQLGDVTIANPVSEDLNPNAVNMTKSLSIAVIARGKFGLKKVNREKLSEESRSRLEVTDLPLEYGNSNNKFATSNSKEYLMEMGALVLKSRTARCDQCSSAVAYLLLQYNAFESSIEIIGNDHHAWIVCRRKNIDTPSSINDMDQWGNEAFIIDLWAAIQYSTDEDVYPAVVEDLNSPHAEYTRSWAEKRGLFVIQSWGARESPYQVIRPMFSSSNVKSISSGKGKCVLL